MPQEANPNETGPERILSREEILSEIRSWCENFEIERELADTEGIYLLEGIDSENSKRYIYQRKGSFPVGVKKIDALKTTIIEEYLDDSYASTVADYDPETNRWVHQ